MSNNAERRYREILASQSAEEVAEDEQRVMVDSARMERMNLIRYMRLLIEEVKKINPKLAKEQAEQMDHIVTVLALWKRNEVVARVALRKLSNLFSEA